jgi:hypothetical protein
MREHSKQEYGTVIIKLTTQDNIRYKNKYSAHYDEGNSRARICNVSISGVECFTFFYIGVTVRNLLLIIILFKYTITNNVQGRTQ